MWWTLGIGFANAFCGAYVGEAGAELTSGVGQVAIVRQGTRTTLTVSNDFSSNVANFAMLVPVPEVLGPEDVHVIDPAVFGHLDVYSGPRLVSYTCDELYPEVPRRSYGIGCSETSLIFDDPVPNRPDDDDVDVEARFIVGEYEIMILDATQSGALLGWLDDEGFAVETTQAGLIQAYLDAGSYFFAARVDTSKLLDGQPSLSPLSFGYDSEVFGLPIRLGTGNSPGAQDLVIYAITDPEAGRVGISNYPERTVEDECLFDGEPQVFGDFYRDAWAAGASDTGDATWVAEYGWNVTPFGAQCDPCPPTETQVPLPFADLVALGFVGATGTPDSGGFTQASYYFTRLRTRYTPAQASQDLALYTSGITDNTQQRYVQHEAYLEDAFPVCGSGWVAMKDAGSCKFESNEMRHRVNYWRRQDDGAGCDHGGAVWVGFLGLLAAAGLRRRPR